MVQRKAQETYKKLQHFFFLFNFGGIVQWESPSLIMYCMIWYNVNTYAGTSVCLFITIWLSLFKFLSIIWTKPAVLPFSHKTKWKYHMKNTDNFILIVI